MSLISTGMPDNALQEDLCSVVMAGYRSQQGGTTSLCPFSSLTGKGFSITKPIETEEGL